MFAFIDGYLTWKYIVEKGHMNNSIIFLNLVVIRKF